jgi:membrane fusion protein, macrolide-specific efflux system
MKKKLFIALGSLTIVSAFLFYLFKSSSVSELQPPRIGPVVEAVYGLGTVVSPQTYQVKTLVGQVVNEIYINEGDLVKKGDPLIRLDGSGEIRAPFEATVTSVSLKKGELLFASNPGVTLVNLKNLYIEVSLEQQAALRVRKGQQATITFESIRGDRLKASVQSIYPRDTQFIVRISLDSFPEGILPGMTSDVAIEVGRKENVLSIPFRAISSGRVTVNRKGKKIKETIKVGVVDGEWAEVVSGNILPDDEIYVRKK